MTRVTKPSYKMVTPTLAPLSLERSAKPNAGFALGAHKTNLAARFRQDQSGTTAIMFGLMIMPVMFLTGMSVDFSRMVTAKSRMQTALDAAALAGVRAAQTNTSSTLSATVMQDAAQKYYDAITSTLKDVRDPRNGATSNKIVMTTQADGSFKFDVNTWVRTPFLSIVSSAGQSPNNSTGAPADCQASIWKCRQVTSSASIIATSSGQNTGYSIETSFMLDITGSMNGQKLADLKVAANNAIDILVWADQSKQTSRVAISPFAQDVRMPTAAAYQAATGQAAATASKSIYGYTFGTKNTEFCVGERQGADKYLDTAPTAGNRPIVEWMYSGWGIQCDVPASATVQPLTSDKTVLHNLINGLQTAGSTAGHIGTQWAWYMLSPNWKSLWQTANQPAAYDTAYNVNTKTGDITKVTLRKIAILMTDGDYNTEYTSQGILTSYFGDSPANATATNQAASICTNMKQTGIEVYTVAFTAGGGISNTALNLLTNCATDSSHFYNASTGTSLNAAFQDIALKISKIRVSG